MPSRRSLLTSLAAGAATVAGCGSVDSVTGFVQLKRIEGWTPGGDNEIVLDVAIDDPPSTVSAHVDERWAEYVDDPERPTLSEAFRDALDRRFEEVWAVVGVCSQAWGPADERSCHNDFTDRESFNRAHVNDRVRATYRDEDDHVEIHRVVGTQTWTAADE